MEMLWGRDVVGLIEEGIGISEGGHGLYNDHVASEMHYMASVGIQDFPE